MTNHRICAVERWCQPWVADLFAVTATLFTLGLRLSLRDQLRDRPTLIVFTVPIMLSAYVGGRRAGLLATALSYAGASYFLLPPFRSFQIALKVDRWDLFFLVLAGVAISILNDALHRAADRTEELQTANKELEAFSYSVSHDLRAPLRSIDGFSKAILENYTDKLDSTGQDYLHRVRSSSQRMEQLIDDMLNLSRVSRGELLHAPTNLSQIAREVIAECRASSTGRNVRVEIADGLIAEADPRLMRVVLTNLLGNAWKFTSKTEHPRIEFGSAGDNRNTEYFVRDNGAGFDMAFADKLFGAFQRLHTDKEFPGTGIGLATIQRVIHRHGGRIRAQSKPGEGATFYFTIRHQTDR